jgi:hypothetical protein
LFAAELAAAGADRDEVVHGIVVAAMWPAWSMLREALGLSMEDASAVMARTVTGLLTNPG